MRCPFDGTEMICVSGSIEQRPGKSWNLEKYLVEEYVCPKCSFRVRARWEVVE